MDILDTGHFKRGFLKTAKDNESFWDKAKPYAPIGLGVTAGAGIYGLLRYLDQVHEMGIMEKKDTSYFDQINEMGSMKRKDTRIAKGLVRKAILKFIHPKLLT